MTLLFLNHNSHRVWGLLAGYYRSQPLPGESFWEFSAVFNADPCPFGNLLPDPVLYMRPIGNRTYLSNSRLTGETALPRLHNLIAGLGRDQHVRVSYQYNITYQKSAPTNASNYMPQPALPRLPLFGLFAIQNALPALALDGAQQPPQSASVLSALGTIVGYLGAEVATKDLFERLLWPQRFYNNFNFRNAAKVGFLMPMGGPLHKAALEALDGFLVNGLFKGARLGNMFGTTFFADSGLTYSVHDSRDRGDGKSLEPKPARNAFWATVVGQIPPTIVGDSDAPNDTKAPLAKTVRARTAVSLLTLSYAGPEEASASKIIENDIGRINLRCLTGIIFTEITGVVVGALVLGLWRSWFCILWWLPLVLKLNSVLWTVPREPLAPQGTHPGEQGGDRAEGQSTQFFEIHGMKRGFLLIEGEPSLVKQFFRHYGHPIRHRFREIVQLGTVIAFCFLFPIGLLCSLIWMSVGLQYMWLGYQLYATVAIHIYRYLSGHKCATTGERVASILVNSGDDSIYFRDAAGTTVSVRISRTEADSVREARDVLKRLLGEETIPGSYPLAKGDEA